MWPTATSACASKGQLKIYGTKFCRFTKFWYIILLPWIIWSKNTTLHRLFWNQNHLLKFSKSLVGDFGNPKLPGVILKVFDHFFNFFKNLSFYYLRLYYNIIFILTAVRVEGFDNFLGDIKILPCGFHFSVCCPYKNRHAKFQYILTIITGAYSQSSWEEIAQ